MVKTPTNSTCCIPLALEFCSFRDRPAWSWLRGPAKPGRAQLPGFSGVFARLAWLPPQGQANLSAPTAPCGFCPEARIPLLNALRGKQSISPVSLVPPACDPAFLSQARHPALGPQALQTPAVPAPGLLPLGGDRREAEVLRLAGPTATPTVPVGGSWRPRSRTPAWARSRRQPPRSEAGNPAALGHPSPVTPGTLTPPVPPGLCPRLAT